MSFFCLFIYFETGREREKERERERENLKQALRSALGAQPYTLGSCPELKSRVGHSTD